jgi:hypothetical protein
MRAIARAYGDQPLDRVVVDRSAKLTYVAAEPAASADPLSGVGFPRDCVFKFDEALFRALCKAWLEGDRARLAALWEDAEPIADDSMEPARHKPRKGNAGLSA